MVAFYETGRGKEMRMSGKKYKIAAQDRKDILMGLRWSRKAALSQTELR